MECEIVLDFARTVFMKKDLKKYAKLFLRIGISSTLIVWLIWKQDFTRIIDYIREYNPLYFLVAIILMIIGTYMSATRWRIILLTSKKDVSAKSLFMFYVKGYFYNNFLPTQMGGDLYKSVALGKKINDQSISLFSVFMDRFGGLLILLTMSLFGLASLQGIGGVFVGSILFIVGLLLYFPILKIFSKKIKFLRKFLEASEMLVGHKKYAALIILFSFLVQLFSFAMVYVLFMGFGINLPFIAVIAYMPLAALSLLIPSFNGFGTQELVYSSLFSTVGVTPEISIAVSVLVHAIRLLMSLVGGVLILAGKK